MSALFLSAELADPILDFLGCKRETPSIRFLNQLIHAYIRHVPWESVSRIIKRHTTTKTDQCPRLPEEFWKEALLAGTGGTCFESNLAFYTLLTRLGFEGYLTINDMETPACHTASMILWQGRKYLADVAIPIHAAIPIDAEKATRRSTTFHHYTIRPIRDSIYRVERSHHPKRHVFSLVDLPVGMESYQKAIERDYEETGYFLDQVIIVKVIGDRLWRFSSKEKPYKLEGFDKTSKAEMILPLESLSASLAEHFCISENKIATALSFVPLL